MTEVFFTPQSAKDYRELDHSVQLQVRPVLARLQDDPERYGEPLGKRAGIDLFGLYSMRAGHRIRVIYLVRPQGVIVVTIGKRENFAAHQTAQARIEALAELTTQELQLLSDVIRGSGGGA